MLDYQGIVFRFLTGIKNWLWGPPILPFHWCLCLFIWGRIGWCVQMIISLRLVLRLRVELKLHIPIWYLDVTVDLSYIYLLTHSMELSPREANRFPASQKFPAFYGTRRFITAFTSARHLSLTLARSIQSLPPHPTSWRSILMLSFHLQLGLSSGPFPSSFPTKTLHTPLLSLIRATCPAHLIGTKVIKHKMYKLILWDPFIIRFTRKAFLNFSLQNYLPGINA